MSFLPRALFLTVLSGIYLRVYIAVTSWKGLGLTVDKICTEDFNGLLETSDKGRRKRTSESTKRN